MDLEGNGYFATKAHTQAIFLDDAYHRDNLPSDWYFSTIHKAAIITYIAVEPICNLLVKRNLQHIIEEESRVNFSQLIPLDWVKNDFVKDYGKDIHIEIFHDQQATGKSFICQLKGKSGRIENDSIAIAITVEDLQYFSQLDTPVLLVFYSTTTKQFWGVWANFLIEIVNPPASRKTVTIRLNADRLIDKEYFVKLQSTFTTDIPYKVNLQVSHLGELGEMWSKRYRGWCNLYFRPYFEPDDKAIPLTLEVQFVESDKEIIPKIRINGKDVRAATIPKTENLSFLIRPYLSDGEIEQPEVELMYITTSAFLRFQSQNPMKLLSLLLHRYHGYHKYGEGVTMIARNAIDTNQIHYLQTLIDLSIEHGNFNDFQFLVAPCLRKESLFPLYEKNLLKVIEKTTDLTLKATFCYNLGNYCRNRDKRYQAVQYYMNAKKLNRQYLKRYYWWHELAGVLFLANHFRLAEKFYLKSIELDQNKVHFPFTYALLGDAYFHQLKFIQARLSYERYLTEVNAMGKVPSGYYAFKGQLCTTLGENGHESKIIDHKATISLLKEGIKEMNTDTLFRSIDAHPLNHYAWMQLGFIFMEKGEYTIGYNCFHAAAVIMETNREYWVKCLIAATQIPDELLATGVFGVMVELFGVDIVNDLSSTVFLELQADLSRKQEIVDYYSKLANLLSERMKDAFYKQPYAEYRFH